MKLQCKEAQMAHIIAVAGKGGVGKTTLSGLLIQTMCQMGKKPVLAVDADANSNLNEVLGVEVDLTLGDVREEVARAENSKDNPIPASMSKSDYTEIMFQRCLVEDDDFDLLVMGRTQGKGCYCFVNGLLQTQLQKLVPNYQYMVVDNEAGMEHISRGILPKVDTIILVSDCSRRGVQAAGRIAELTRECDMKPKTMGLIVNRAPGGVLNEGTKEEIEKQGLTLLGVVPHDDQVYEYDCDGNPTINLPEDSPVRLALNDIITKLAF
jgi:CO dehydrogenase maturation factor